MENVLNIPHILWQIIFKFLKIRERKKHGNFLREIVIVFFFFHCERFLEPKYFYALNYACLV